MHSDSKKVVVSALIGNSLITVSKFIVAMFSGSSAMFAESIHSLADTGNQVLLLLGMKLSKREANDLHPFGYGKERYFWAMLVAVSMFVIGSVVSFYEGIHKIMDPQPLANITWIYIVLGASFAFECYPFYIAYKALRSENSSMGILSVIRKSKRPAVIVVFLEDLAALLGILIALLGVTIANAGGLLIFDGIASICIGVLLALVAFTVAYEIRSLLVGESATEENIELVRTAAQSVDGVRRVLDVLTMQMGPEELLINLNLAFEKRLNTDALEAIIDEVEAEIKRILPEARYISIEAESTDEPAVDENSSQPDPIT